MDKNARIVLTDKDDTLVDARIDALTDPRIHQLVQACQDRGFLIGLNSDSPVEPLRDLARHVGMRGPILAEGGAIFLPDPEAMPITLIPGDCAELLVEARLILRNAIDPTTIFLLEGDVVSLRKQGLPRSWPPNTRIIAMNALRRASFMCFVWISDREGVLQPDPIGLEEVVNILKRRVFPSDGTFRVNAYATYGVLIAHAEQTSKTFGTVALQRHMSPASLTMIGDSMQDDCGADVYHVAVQNANDDYRRFAKMVLNQPYTSGVCEYLESLLR